jgi:predicted amidohydrolase
LENGVFVVSLSHAGEQYGESIACPPWIGDITRIKDNAEYTEQLEVSIVAGTAEGALNVSVDLALLDDVRRIIPFQKVSRCIVLS